MIPKLDQILYRLKMSNLGKVFYGETAGIQMDVLNDTGETISCQP